jgi:hypothetical protein
MKKLPNLNNLLFDVDDFGYVYLCYGPLRVVVSNLNEFERFTDDLIYKITEIKNEIKENYQE